MQEGEETELSVISEMNTAYIEMMLVNIGGESVLISVSDVSEVIRLQPLSQVPMAPEHLLGVCNVHGHIVCVIDPCRVMHLDGKPSEDSPASRFVSLRHPVMNLALRVDSVSELFRIQESEFSELSDDSSAFFRNAINIEGCEYRVINTQALFA
ncbi:MAG: chemotaxis protein CheW [Mariprofundaceae bacterium]|nr:chemotaxis protein CheW [Mariprofundaceae bacterium]